MVYWLLAVFYTLLIIIQTFERIYKIMMNMLWNRKY